MDAFKLKEGFILGVSSSSLEIEGKNKRGSWYDWYKKGHIKDNANPNIAADHYELYKEDFLLMRKMGITHYRFGISWSRIEPVKGVFNNGELDYYAEMLSFMLSCGITPMLTLIGNDLPIWFLDEGGFESEECEKIVVHYVKKIAEMFSGSVKEFITFDEPNLYALNSHFYGAWPPGKRSTGSLSKVLSGIAGCHIAAYEALHEACGDVKVGCSVNMRVFEPKDEKSFYQRKCAIKMENYFQNAILNAVAFGKVQKPLKNFGKSKGDYCDFWALSYYTRSTVSGLSDGVREGVAVDDLGQEIYPRGIVECAEKLYKLKTMPIYVTANGVCDNNDSCRIKYICEHLKAISESELPISRYYYRSFLDGFEGLEGESARFGLVKTDFRTKKRSVKKSGEFYSELISRNAFTGEMDIKYSPEQFFKNSKGESLDKIDEVFFDMQKALSTEAGESVITKVSQYVNAPDSYDEKQMRAEKVELQEKKTEEPKGSKTLPENVCENSGSAGAESSAEVELTMPKEAKEEENKKLINDMSSFSASAIKEAMEKAMAINSEEQNRTEPAEQEAESVMAEIAQEMEEEGSEYSNFEALLNEVVAQQAEENVQANENKDLSEGNGSEASSQTEEDKEEYAFEKQESSEESVGSILDLILEKESVQTEISANYEVYDNEEDSLDYAVNEVFEENVIPEPEQTAVEETEGSQDEEEVLLDDDDYIDMFLN